jgi:hypothetical protein
MTWYVARDGGPVATDAPETYGVSAGVGLGELSKAVSTGGELVVADSPVGVSVTKLEPGTGGILVGTKRVVSGATTWHEITVHGRTGWVNAAYIAPAPQVPASPTQSSTPP